MDTYAEQIHVRGIVQGVGFRPFVWRLARQGGLRGHVYNDIHGVTIQLWGPLAKIELFLADLEQQAPPLADIQGIERRPMQPSAQPPQDFQILLSPQSSAGGRSCIPADIAVCSDCAAEVLDAQARRYRYPFTNCTHCGPRLSIVCDLPYDRQKTEMAPFPMCPQCWQEYCDPSNRRYHAQAICCSACGPRVWLRSTSSASSSANAHEIDPQEIVSEAADSPVDSPVDSIGATVKLLLDGYIVAIKGLGGFQLACDASNPAAIERLRLRKRRPHKPLALMAPDLASIRRYCYLDAGSTRALQGPCAPIVLLLCRTDLLQDEQNMADALAPGLSELGWMLPTTPLHLLLLHDIGRPLVMTSGNISNEPQCIGNTEALENLQSIADYFLLHNRRITCRLDDSVQRSCTIRSKPDHLPILMPILRRARGYAPQALRLPASLCALLGGKAKAMPDILAFGSQEKSTFAFICHERIVLSQYVGDLAELGNWQDFLKTLRHYTRLYGFRPGILACDSHPEYINSKYARQLCAEAVGTERIELAEIQHHHAHIAACMAEHELEDAVAVVWDGLGYGDDGRGVKLWGAEFFRANYRSAHRLASLQPIPLLGNQLAVRQPWRCLLAWLLQLCPSYGPEDLSSRMPEQKGQPAQRLLRIVGELESLLAGLRHCVPPLAAEAQIQPLIASAWYSPHSSSAGRLFDAVGALLLPDPQTGNYLQTSYDAQAAIELQALAQQWLLRQRLLTPGQEAQTARLTKLQTEGQLRPYPYRISEYVQEFRAKPSTQSMSGQDVFLQLDPRPMWRALLQDLQGGQERGRCAARFHLSLACAVGQMVQRLAFRGPVVLCGGVFQNGLLLGLCRQVLEGAGCQVTSPQCVPANDGGLALGQAVIAAARWQERAF